MVLPPAAPWAWAERRRVGRNLTADGPALWVRLTKPPSSQLNTELLKLTLTGITSVLSGLLSSLLAWADVDFLWGESQKIFYKHSYRFGHSYVDNSFTVGEEKFSSTHLGFSGWLIKMSQDRLAGGN